MSFQTHAHLRIWSAQVFGMAKAKARLRPTGTAVVKEVKPRGRGQKRAGPAVADGKLQVLGNPADAAKQIDDLVVGARAEATF